MVNEYSYGIIPLRKLKSGYRLLLIQHHAGHWAFPKGHSEEGESPQQVAERELFEETGLRVDEYLSDQALTEQYVFTFQQKKIFKKVDYFVAFVKGRVKIQMEEIKDYKWLSLEQAEACMTFKEGKKLCEKVMVLISNI